MAVSEQTPYIEHTGNGVATSFSLGFQCESKDHLIVLVDEIEPPIATWSLNGGNVVFTTAPAAGKKITLQRNTPFSRNVDYQAYNNSFKPQPVNNDFDKIWLKLQELGVTNWLTDTDIKNLSAYVNSLNDETRDEFYNNLGNLEKNTKAMLDEAIKNGAVSALAITTVDTVEELEDLSAWGGRTVYVKDVANFKYDSADDEWVLAKNKSDSLFDDDAKKDQKEINKLSAPAYIKAYGETNPIKHGAGDRDYSPNDDLAFAACLAEGKRDIYLPDQIDGSRFEYLTTQKIVLPGNTGFYGVGAPSVANFSNRRGATIRNTTTDLIQVGQGCEIANLQLRGAGYYAGDYSESTTLKANPAQNSGIVFDSVTGGVNEVKLFNITAEWLYKGIDLSRLSAADGNFAFRIMLENIKVHFNRYGIYHQGRPNQVLQSAILKSIWSGFNGTGLFISRAQNLEIDMFESEATRDTQHAFLQYVDAFSFSNYNFENRTLPADLVGVAHPGNAPSAAALLASKPFLRLYTCQKGILGSGRMLRYRTGIYSEYSSDINYGRIVGQERSLLTLDSQQYDATIMIYSEGLSSNYKNHICSTKPIIPTNVSNPALRGNYTLLSGSQITVVDGLSKTICENGSYKVQSIANNTDSAFSDKFSITQNGMNAKGLPTSATGLVSGDLYKDTTTNTIKYVT